MKSFFLTLCVFLVSFCMYAQSPQAISYQAVARDAQGQVLANASISLRISILQGSTTGSAVYSEKHNITTNLFGLLNIQIGRGTTLSGTFSNINWGADRYFSKIEIDIAGGSNFKEIGISEMLSVPYAMHAKTVENEKDPIFISHPAYRITSDSIKNWNSAFSWGNHAGLYKPLAYVPSWSEITASPFNIAAPENNQLLRYSAASGKWENWTPNFSNTKELQTIRISNDTIYLSNGGFVKLPPTSAGALLPPASTSLAASSVQSFSANLNGTVNGKGLSTSVVFEWGSTTSYGHSLPYTSPITGSSDSNVSTNLAGLQSATTYHYRIKATNAVNAVYSNDMTFTTSNSAPQLSSIYPSTVKALSATAGGTISNSGGADVTARGVCWGTSPNPTIAGNKTSDGTGTGSFTSSITGLNTSTTYYVRSYATNSIGTSYGEEYTFTTRNGIISLISFSVNSILANSASIAGSIGGDGGGSDITERGVCWSTSTNPTIMDSKASDATLSGSFTNTITGLSPNTTYYARVYATNGVGTFYSEERSFTTKNGVVSLSTQTSSYNQKITPTTVELNYNSISDDGGAPITARGICWGTATAPTINNDKTVDGTGRGLFNSTISGLSPATTYYARAYATNSMGTYYGNEISFNTPSLPTLTTTAVSSIGGVYASCGGKVTSTGKNSSGTGVYVHYGVCWSTTPSPSIANSSTSDGSSNEITTFSSSLTGLSPQTTYYVRAYAKSDVGTAYGNELSFTTKALILPTLSTINVSSISSTGASIGGNVTADGGAPVTERGVCWGTTANPTVLSNRVTSGTGIGTFSCTISGLTAGTSYYARAYAITSAGTAYGDDVVFKASLRVGDSYQGGIIAYFLQEGDPGYIAGETHGLIIAPTDQSTGIQWYNGSNSTTGATATAIGTGNANTNAIIASQGVGSYAAQVCADLILGGYSDWYLPSRDELQKICSSINLNNGIASYWSSTEGGLSDAYLVEGYNGNSYLYSYPKSDLKSVRAVRSFTTGSVALPTIATNTVSSVKSTTATCGGNVSLDGGATVTSRGICWSTTSNPTISGSKTTDGTGTGAFTSSITGLRALTTYYVRSYATTTLGTVYGRQYSFTTAAGVLPTVATTAVTSIASSSAKSGSNVSDDGGINVLATGVCWSTSPNPTTSNNKTTDGNGTGKFTSTLSSLTIGTTYYIRAYATNSAGTAYGNQISFTATMGVGDSYQGGTIAYVLQVGDPGYVAGEFHGVIAAATDQSSGIQWYNGTNTTTGATETAIGSGKANTAAIIASQGAGSYAAKLCDDLVSGGYSDWYLPSKDELGLLISNGILKNTSYWSSSESYSYCAYDGSSPYTSKSSALSVRAIRTF